MVEVVGGVSLHRCSHCTQCMQCRREGQAAMMQRVAPTPYLHATHTAPSPAA